MAARTSFADTASAPQMHTFDQQTLQDVALACVEVSGIVAALASNDAKRARHIAERLGAVLNASPLSLPSALECTCQRTMGCAHRRFGDHLKASECFKLALAQPDGEDAFQRVNTLMLLSNSLSSLQRFNLALESASHAQQLLQSMLFEQPHLMAVGADDSSVQMVRLVVAVHFRVGVLKQQLGNHAGARDACHAIEVSKTLLGRFSLGQQMLRIVREDGTLIPVGEQITMRSLSDNLNITGNLSSTGPAFASEASAAPQRAQLAASSIYSSNSSGLSSLMPKLRVPEPDMTDPTESLRELSQLTEAPWNARGHWDKQPAHAALDGTRDMWQGEFAPGLGRLQLPDVETELSRAEGAGRRGLEPLFLDSGTYAAQNSHTQQHRRNYDHAKMEVYAQTAAIGTFAGSLVDSAWVPRSSHATIERVPGSYASSPNVRDAGKHAHAANRFDEHAVISGQSWLSKDAFIRDGGSSCAAVASVRIADPDVSIANADQNTGDNARDGDHARESVPLWSEHQASPIVDMLHQYLKQQHEHVNALRDSAVTVAMTVNDAAPDNLSQQPPSPRRENDSSPLPSNARQNLVGHAAAQDDEVAGFLFSRNLPETELRLASRFKDVDTDDRMIDFTVEDFLCECASMTSAIESDLRRELEHIAQRPETELQRELENIASRGAGNT